MQQELHRNPQYGVASLAYAPLIAKLLERYPVTRLSPSSGGCRKYSSASS
jgi:hypothetical protein